MTGGPTRYETISASELFEKVEAPLLERQLHLLAMRSEFYRDKLERAGLKPEDACRLQNFTDLPFTEKREVLADQEAHPPFGSLPVTTDPGLLRRVHSTSGSTGRPFVVVLSERDVAETHDAGARAFRCAGVRPGDRVVHCLNYQLWAGGLTDHLSLEAAGATVVPFGVGNTHRLIETIRQLRVTTISCTPSYMRRLEQVLEAEFHLRPRDLGLKRGLFGGEGGLQDPAVRGRVEDVWGIQAMDANYGMADVLSIFGAECPARTGLHFHGQGILRLELIDPASGASLPLETGRTGEMVLTHLAREAQPLLRYRTRDVIRVTGLEEPCACGRRSLRFVVVGRSDDMVVVRGVNVYPGNIAGVLAEFGARLSGEYELVVESPPPVERPLLRVELSPQAQTGAPEDLAIRIALACAQRLSFTPRVDVLPNGSFPRTEGKTRRLRLAYQNPADLIAETE
jgi:phenylacetate-CoA ligase